MARVRIAPTSLPASGSDEQNAPSFTSPGPPNICGSHSPICSLVPLLATATAASPVPPSDKPMPASPQNNSSKAVTMPRPLGSIHCEPKKSSEYSPILAASSMIGQGVSSRSSHSAAAGLITSAANPCTQSRICATSGDRASENPLAPWSPSVPWSGVLMRQLDSREKLGQPEARQYKLLASNRQPKASAAHALGPSKALVRDQLDLEPVGVLQIGGVVLGSAGVRMPVGKHQLPAVQLGVPGQLVDMILAGGVEREMIQARAQPIVPGRRACRRLLNDYVNTPRSPAPATWPVLKQPVAELGQEPAPAHDRPVQVGDPQFHVVDHPDPRLHGYRRDLLSGQVCRLHFTHVRAFAVLHPGAGSWTRFPWSAAAARTKRVASDRVPYLSRFSLSNSGKDKRLGAWHIRQVAQAGLPAAPGMTGANRLCRSRSRLPWLASGTGAQD